MSEQKLTGEKLAQAIYNKIVEAAKQLQPKKFIDYDECTGLIIIGFQGKEHVFMHRVGLISELEAIKFLEETMIAEALQTYKR